MAKYRHKIFEMFDDRAEALAELTPKSKQHRSGQNSSSPWNPKCLNISLDQETTIIEFEKNTCLDAENLAALQDDLKNLEQRLPRNSIALIDFSGVVSINAESIQALVSFKQDLKTKGSRMAICSLAPEPRKSFFDDLPQSFSPVSRHRRR
jgi:anti-anti-sigma regulatory factor